MKLLKIISILKSSSCIILLIIVFSCKNKEIVKIISPSENIKTNKNSTSITEAKKTSYQLDDIKANLNINNLNLISSNNNIYIFEKETKKIKKSYFIKFDNKELISVKFVINPVKTKLLVITSTGQSSKALLFQIDLKSLEIDWTTEYAIQISTSAYSNNSKQIVLGTNSYIKNSSQYYASLFTLNSKNGEYINYFEQGESVAKIKFSKDDKSICAILDWPHTDSFIWNVNNQNKKIAVLGRDQTSYYDACFTNDNTLISIGNDGIYRWDISNPKNFKIVHKMHINETDRLFKIDQLFLLIDYPKGSANPPIINYFDSKLKLIDAVPIKIIFENITISNSKLQGTGDNNQIIYFDIKNKQVIDMQ